MPAFLKCWWAALGVLLVSRVLATLLPGMGFWALNSGRFVPVAGGLALLVMGVALAPALASRAVSPLEWLGDLPSRSPWQARAIWFVAGAGLVLALPDRTHFVGDFMLRVYAIQGGGPPSDLFPQAFPADVWLHYSMPRWCEVMKLCPAEINARALGGIEAGLLGVLGVELSRALRLSGVASCVATAALLLGAPLGTMTGYPKAFSELVVCAAAMGVVAIRAGREGRGIGWVGLWMGLALLLHRSSLLLLPALVVCLFNARNCSKRDLAIAVAAPLLVLVVMAPRIAGATLRFDLQPAWPSMHDLALHGLDVVNLVLLSPLLILALASGWAKRQAGLTLVVLASAFAFPLLLHHPRQGIFRDWDLFAAPMVLLSVAAAAHVATALSRLTRRQLWIGPAMVASIALPVAIGMAGQSNLEAGLKRAEAFAVERPARAPDERGMLWTFLCERWAQLGNHGEAARTGQHAAELAPTRNLLLLLASTERTLGDQATALQTYRRLLKLEGTNAEAWYCVAVYSARSGDFVEADHALDQLARLDVPPVFMAYARSQVERERRR